MCQDIALFMGDIDYGLVVCLWKVGVALLDVGRPCELLLHEDVCQLDVDVMDSPCTYIIYNHFQLHAFVLSSYN